MNENPTTGFAWIIPEVKEHFNYIWTLEDSEYTQDNNPKGLVGVGGTRKFLIGIEKPGDEFLTLVYGRPWLYNQTITDFYKTGKFNATLMEGHAFQLGIEAQSLE